MLNCQPDTWGHGLAIVWRQECALHLLFPQATPDADALNKCPASAIIRRVFIRAARGSKNPGRTGG
jgi:hypothetical protein